MIVRDAAVGDAARLAELIALLGHEVTVEGVAARLSRVHPPQLVAEVGGRVVGLCGLAVTEHLHRETPVGRITILVVDAEVRGRGVGRRLVEEAERRLAALGCAMVEVTSNHRLTEAHAFYARLGYDQPSLRFAKPL
ncbi:GNAT family N-acetyltransferase [Sphingomonas sp. ASV193]|uniref:GNAT family N-acetyltransferase n=1 Tax=Sphingomonas sp. ASV193 TaxID=3144405 RepID=UPI0032E93251